MIKKEFDSKVIEKYTCPTCGGHGKYPVHPWDDWDSFEFCHDCDGEGYVLLFEGKVIRDYIPCVKVREFM